MKRSMMLGCVCAAAGLFAPAMARASAPGVVPIQGILTDNGGAVLDGAYTLTLALYDGPVAVSPFFLEVQTVTVEQGVFSVYVGNTVPLDLAEFVTKQAYLGLKVGADPEMSPRMRFGTVPYAAYAEHANVADPFPAGAIMHFDLPDCPAGWSVFTEAQGRAIVGLPDAGMAKGTVGASLTDLEDRQHTHLVDPAVATSSTSGDHTHDVDPANVFTSSADTSHNHDVNPGPFQSASYTHSHVWAQFSTSSLGWFTYDSGGVSVSAYDWIDGMDTAGGGNYPLSNDGVNTTFFTDNDIHSHSIDVPNTTTTTTNQSHGHSVNIASTTSTTAGAHAHTVDVAAVSSLPAPVSSVMPYVQLLVCRKD